MNPNVIRSINSPDLIAALLQRGMLQYINLANIGWTQTNVGSGSSGFTPSYATLATGITGSSSAKLHTPLVGLGRALDRIVTIDWSKKLRLYMQLASSAQNVNTTLHIQLKHTSAIGALADKGIGLKLANLALTGESYNSELGSNALLSLSNSIGYLIEIRHYPATPKVEFWVDGVLKATESTSTKVPQAGYATGDDYLVISADNGVTSESGTYYLSGIWIWQER